MKNLFLIDFYINNLFKKGGILMSNQSHFSDIFPIGFYNDLHPNFGVNFQMNRCYNFSNDNEMLMEMRAVSSHIKSYHDFINEFEKLYEQSLENGHKLRAAHYLRITEFYMTSENPKKDKYRKQFISLMREYFGIGNEFHHLVPYENGFMSTYRLMPKNPRGTFVVFGGFDSYIEEMFKTVLVMKESGFDIILFDGPGQGSTLEDYHIPMTHEWEKPVKAILDYFNLDDVTLIGISLGGCLVIRAAAFDNRIKRVVADNVCYNFFDVLLQQFPTKKRNLIKYLVQHKNKLHASIINYILRKQCKKNLMLEWGIAQGMHVMGVTTPYDFFRKSLLFSAKDISHLLIQDVLLLGAKEDHFIPHLQFFDQGKALVNVHSLTSRLFTNHEMAQNHCQIGNLGLSIAVIINWVEQTMK